MKPRKLKDLYLLLLDNIKNNKMPNANYSGICRARYSLYMNEVITPEEYLKLLFHFKKCKPTARNKFKSFYLEDIFNKDDMSVYWWRWMSSGQEYIDVRVRFLEAIITTLK